MRIHKRYVHTVTIQNAHRDSHTHVQMQVGLNNTLISVKKMSLTQP